MKLLLVSTLCIAAVSLAPAQAQAVDDADVVISPKHPPVEIELKYPPPLDEAVRVNINEIEGAWMPMWMARQMQSDVEQFQIMRPAIEKQETLLKLRVERLDIKNERIIQTKEALQLSMDAEERTKGIVEAAVRAQRQAEEDLEVWYRQPAFLISVGAVSIILVEVGAFLIFKSLEASERWTESSIRSQSALDAYSVLPLGTTSLCAGLRREASAAGRRGTHRAVEDLVRQEVELQHDPRLRDDLPSRV